MNENCVEDWQALKSCMLQRTNHLFDNELMSDIHFLVGEEPNIRRIPAHKFLLSIGSCVFNTMFNGAVPCNEETIKIPDVKSCAFYALLRFLYTDTVELINIETALSTLYAAKKYMVLPMQIECVKFLSNHLSTDNVIQILIQALLYDEHQLTEKCWSMIDNYTEIVVGINDFTDIDHDTLCMILIRKSLNITEAKLFKAVLKWSVVECERRELSISGSNQRSVLGDALKLIRFPLMTAKEFTESSAIESGLLEKDEIISIFVRIAKSDVRTTYYDYSSYGNCCNNCRGNGNSLPRSSLGTISGSW